VIRLLAEPAIAKMQYYFTIFAIMQYNPPPLLYPVFPNYLIKKNIIKLFFLAQKMLFKKKDKQGG
jgi:hypothetical protein